MKVSRVSSKRLLVSSRSVAQNRLFSSLSDRPVMAFEAFNAPDSTSTPTHAIGFFHGILGSKKNWRTPAKVFIQQNPQYSAFTADWRGHGEANEITSAFPPNNLKSCAEDLNRLFTSVNFQKKFPQFHVDSPISNGSFDLSFQNRSNIVLCAHSFGGKVLLEYICQLIKHSPKEASPTFQFTTFILDSIPDLFDPDHDSILHKHQSVFSIIKMLQEAPESYPSKEAALKYLESTGQTSFVSQWLLMNLVPIKSREEDGGKIIAWKFGFDIHGISELFSSFQHHSYWDLLEKFNNDPGANSFYDPEIQGKIVFIRAGKNPFWKHNRANERLEEICQRNPYIHLVTMPHVGHWLHSEDLKGLLETMKQFLPK